MPFLLLSVPLLLLGLLTFPAQCKMPSTDLKGRTPSKANPSSPDNPQRQEHHQQDQQDHRNASLTPPAKSRTYHKTDDDDDEVTITKIEHNRPKIGFFPGLSLFLSLLISLLFLLFLLFCLILCLMNPCHIDPRLRSATRVSIMACFLLLTILLGRALFRIDLLDTPDDPRQVRWPFYVVIFGVTLLSAICILGYISNRPEYYGYQRRRRRRRHPNHRYPPELVYTGGEAASDGAPSESTKISMETVGTSVDSALIVPGCSREFDV